MKGQDDDTEIPEYFVCPISLQIMKDPVTAVTGITYDRISIERWLSKSSRGGGGATCPVTKQPLPRNSDLTPNHTLHRLIEAWSTSNATTPTQNSPIDGTRISTLIRDLGVDGIYVNSLKKLYEIVSSGSEMNRKLLLENGVAEAMIIVVTKRVEERKVIGLEDSLKILDTIWSSTRPELKVVFQHNHDFIDALTWILRNNNINVRLKVHASTLLKKVTEVASLTLLERLKPELFKSLMNALRSIKTYPDGIKSALQVLNDTCPCGRNRLKIMEAGAVFKLIELELDKPEKRITELIFSLLAQMCATADGRAQLIQHAAGIAMVAKRTIRVSPAVDDRAVKILSLVSKHSGTNEVLSEMLRVGAVSKLCMVLQADCAAQLKSRARSVLRMHPNAWYNSPCIQVYLLTMHAAR